MTMCTCKPFCETHGRDEIAVGPAGSEFCNECAADGFSGELCIPAPDSYDMLHPKANEWERQFMCAEHSEQHRAFCSACDGRPVCDCCDGRGINTDIDGNEGACMNCNGSGFLKA